VQACARGGSHYLGGTVVDCQLVSRATSRHYGWEAEPNPTVFPIPMRFPVCRATGRGPLLHRVWSSVKKLFCRFVWLWLVQCGFAGKHEQSMWSPPDACPNINLLISRDTPLKTPRKALPPSLTPVCHHLPPPRSTTIHLQINSGHLPNPSTPAALPLRTVESITKERKAQKVFTNYTINPNTLLTVTGKPNIAEPELVGATGGPSSADQLIETLHNAKQPPTAKYDYPMTEAQEIGWDASHYVRNKTSVKNAYRQQTEITNYMDAAWKAKSQQSEAAGAPAGK
jgi:hypothetical protein